MKDLSKTYNPRDVEDEIYKRWEESGFFNPDNLEKAHDRYWQSEPFSIAMPPPNATAALHVGHAMFLTIQDMMTRHARMAGKKALWLPGTDHAAIATQNVVERKLWEEEKKTRHDVGRETMLQKIEEYVAKTRGQIQQQIRKMGSSCDWSREKYTLSPELSLAVRTVFKKMHDAGLIYRGNRIVNWCTRCGTTLADDEVQYKPAKGTLYYIKYPFVKNKGEITIATTRPETMLADTAVAVHPKDKRFHKIAGQSVMLPLLNRELPIIEDAYVDESFGTGALKITPGHDPHDFEIGQRHKLEIINLFTTEGVISAESAADNGFEDYAGLTPEDARTKIVQALADGGFLEKTEPIDHNVGACYRCDTRVEPIISKQWFVNVNEKLTIKNQNLLKLLKLKSDTTLKEMAAAAVKSGAIKIVPERFTKIYLHWMENMHDWNISRQIWFGHRVPVWYCASPSQSSPEGKTMGFHHDVVPQVLAGKTKTYRLRDHDLKNGDRVIFKNSQTEEIFGSGLITAVEKVKAENIDLKDPAHSATYEKLEDLLARFKLHNPNHEVTPQTEVFIYTYRFTPQSSSNENCGETIVSVETPNKCPNCGNASLTQDPDTLDTWFSSSLWTFSSLGWPQETSDLKTYHPTTIMETGYDILFFWVARMVLMTTFALEDIPFRTVYLNGLVRDIAGKKMSKSLRNVLNPLEVIDKYGTDALRLSMIIGTTPGNDTKNSDAKVENCRNFVNKLWNVSRFILSFLPPDLSSPISEEKLKKEATLADFWILSELDDLTTAVNKFLETYQYGQAGEALLDFTWNKFADWYLEIAKISLPRHPRNSAAGAEPGDPSPILRHILQTLLKLWHPFIPFVTEHIWSQFSEEMLMIQAYPAPSSFLPLKKGEIKRGYENFTALQNLIVGLRNLRSEFHQPPAEIFACYIESAPDWLREQLPIVEKLARVRINFDKVPADKKMPYFLWKKSKIYLIIPRFDAPKELALTEKELKTVKAQVAKLEAQLSKKNFLQKAPKEIVAKLKTDFEAAQDRLGKLQEKIKQLS